MRKASLGVLWVLAAGTILALGCLAIVYAAEIVAFFGNYAMWIISAVAVATALNVIVGMALGWMLRGPELRRRRSARTTTAWPARVVAIPAPTSPHDSEHDLPDSPARRSPLTAVAPSESPVRGALGR